MRIIIEIDSNNQPEIKKVSSEEPATTLLTQSAPVDAGVANIPVQENMNLSGYQDSIDDMNIGSNTTNVKSIDAGAYNANRSDSDSTMGLSSHENDLAMAVSSGSALDAGESCTCRTSNGWKPFQWQKPAQVTLTGLMLCQRANLKIVKS
jgi:hypothetical protein